MLFLYDIGIQLYIFLIRLAALSNKKAAAWVNGRKGLIRKIEADSTNSRPLWFHFASLGEFEQGRPVLERIKTRHPDVGLVVTFFSPSGYEVRKDYALADHVYYLPADTRQNAREFIRILNPAAAIFTKYEYWYHYFNELYQHKVPLFMISGIFREQQPFFKWYGSLHRKMLGMVTHFFVQNAYSKELLAKGGIMEVSITGDTRFDRVVKNARSAKGIENVQEFCSGRNVFIAGSSWQADEELLSLLPGMYPEWKFIIAPHEVSEVRVSQVEKLFTGAVRFSDLKSRMMERQTLIIDNIGMLSSLYQYGDIAYIGGGFGAGIHNTQEAAAFGLPVIFGPRYHKFREARDLIEKGAAFSINTSQELKEVMIRLVLDEDRKKAGNIARSYIFENAGATKKIVSFLEGSGLFDQSRASSARPSIHEG